ncbi:hypothetical protein ACFX1X_023688 [Malus domestica]
MGRTRYNLHAIDNKWENVTNLRTSIKEKGLKKTSGHSVVEVGSDIHSFVAGYRLQLDSDQISGVLGKLEVKMICSKHDMADAV